MVSQHYCDQSIILINNVTQYQQNNLIVKYLFSTRITEGIVLFYLCDNIIMTSVQNLERKDIFCLTTMYTNKKSLLKKDIATG